MTEVRGSKRDVYGRVFNPLGYSVAVERGSRPHTASLRAIEQWAKRKLGVDASRRLSHLALDPASAAPSRMPSSRPAWPRCSTASPNATRASLTGSSRASRAVPRELGPRDRPRNDKDRPRRRHRDRGDVRLSARARRTWTEAERDALMAVGGTFHCWFVSMAPEQPYVTKRFPATHEHSVYQFNLHGYLAVNDAAASEKTFAILVERIIAAFRAAKPGLSTAAFTNVVDEAGPMEWVESGYRVFAGVSCHYARLAFPTREQTEP
jgi:hypothetical protein